MPSESTGVSVKTEKTPTVPASAPWAPFEALRNDIDRVFENFAMSPFKLRFGRRMFDLDLPRATRSTWDLTPAVDVTEKGNGYEVTVELPGMTEKDVEVKISNGLLTIRGEKKETKETQEKE
jgi:HSP20 family protein